MRSRANVRFPEQWMLSRHMLPCFAFRRSGRPRLSWSIRLQTMCLLSEQSCPDFGAVMTMWVGTVIIVAGLATSLTWHPEPGYRSSLLGSCHWFGTGRAFIQRSPAMSRALFQDLPTAIVRSIAHAHVVETAMEQVLVFRFSEFLIYCVTCRVHQGVYKGH